MRPSRSILALAAVASVPAVALGFLTGGSSTPTAAAPAAVTAPVAAEPEVVAHAVVAPAQAVTTKPSKPTVKATRRPAAKPVAKPVVTRTVRRTVAAPKPAATTTTPSAPVRKPASTTTVSSSRTGNDYPYSGATTNASDKWGFTQRQCVSFAAWRLARGGHAISNVDGWGSALHWDETARASGVRVSTTPHVGAIAQWNAGEAGKVWMSGGTGRFAAGSYGHVGYVAAVYSDGSALIEQYNAMGDRSYSVMRMTAPRYLF